MKKIVLSVVPLVALGVALWTYQARSPRSGPQPSSDVVAGYADVANEIISAALADSAAYDRLAYMADTFGPRFSGTPNLERAIDWLLQEMTRDGLDNVHGEPVKVPKWVRGRESLHLIAPREQELAVLGLGRSIGTPSGGIEADVLVVRSFEDLDARKEEATGKVVLFNAPFTTYRETVVYRSDGANRASEAGAVASLVRSVGPVSLYTPHTGAMSYKQGIRRIPHAAVTVEDALMMQRMQDRGQPVRVRLFMDAHVEPDAESRNVVAELEGSEYPDEVVIMGGHIDSWDVGQGAMDDGGGCVAAWHALLLLKRMGLRPKRTIRVVMWTNEENGLKGALTYRDAHAAEINDIVLAIESDGGVFKPTGFGFAGTDDALNTVRQVGSLLDAIEAGSVTPGGGGADIGPLIEKGVPGMGLMVDGSKYFWYHHTHADTIDKLDPGEMNLCIAAMAVVSYVVADMPARLPRSE